MEHKAKKQKGHIVKESNMLARAKIKPAVKSAWAMRLIATVAARNTTSDEIFREHQIDLREFNRGEELSTLQFKELENAVSRLAHSTYEIRTKGSIKAYPIFRALEATRQKVTAEFNEKLKPHYLQLRACFTLLCLSDFQKLTSVYAQKMYEILCSWRSEREVEISLGELHSLLGVPASFTKQFGHFKERVLEVAHREINAAAENSTSNNPLEYEWEPVKSGEGGRTSKVVAIRFMFNVSGRRSAAMIEEFREKLKSRTNDEKR